MEAGKASRSAMGSGLLRAAHVRGCIELFDAGRLRNRYLRDRPDLPLPGTTLIAVATA